MKRYELSDWSLTTLARLRDEARVLIADEAGVDDLVERTLLRGVEELKTMPGGTDLDSWLVSKMRRLASH